MNSVNFSPCGDLIVSGSDDLQVAVWDWCKDTKEPLITYDSGHSSNVFQVCRAVVENIFVGTLIWVIRSIPF